MSPPHRCISIWHELTNCADCPSVRANGESLSLFWCQGLKVEGFLRVRRRRTVPTISSSSCQGLQYFIRDRDVSRRFLFKSSPDVPFKKFISGGSLTTVTVTVAAGAPLCSFTARLVGEKSARGP